MMIDAKSFMEFFEQESGIKFIDANSGRPALQVLKEQKRSRKCQNCASAVHGDGVILHLGDIICGNRQSDKVTDWVDKNYCCEFWSKVWSKVVN